MRVTEVWRAVCPRCNAQPGKHCVNEMNGARAATHTARIRVAKEMNREK